MPFDPILLPGRIGANRTRHDAGFTLMEALVTLLVVSLGMLAIVGLQIRISQNADLGKQRTEATRLAQQKLEELRSFSSLTAYTSNMASSGDTISADANYATNTTFVRSWMASAAASPDSGRTVQVAVGWTDSAGIAQQVQLVSSIAAADPLVEGGLWFPVPDGTILRRPKNRSIDIPIPAKSISGTGKSFVPWTGYPKGYLVFSDASGDVVQKCSSEPTALSLTNDNCVTFDGYILAGYISGSEASSVTSISLSDTAHISGTPECSVGQAYDQNSLTTAISGYFYYVCLISPTDHDSNVATARVWTARSDVAGSGLGPGTYTCRYTPSATTTINEQHPATYTLVDRSLDNQNFLTTTKASDCSGTGLTLHKTN